MCGPSHKCSYMCLCARKLLATKRSDAAVTSSLFSPASAPSTTAAQDHAEPSLTLETDRSAVSEHKKTDTAACVTGSDERQTKQTLLPCSRPPLPKHFRSHSEPPRTCRWDDGSAATDSTASHFLRSPKQPAVPLQPAPRKGSSRAKALALRERRLKR